MIRMIPIVVLALCSALFSQEAARGTVTDFNTSAPVMGVFVKCEALGLGDTTDAAGQFIIGGSTATAKGLTNKIFQTPGRNSMLLSYQAGTGPVKVALYDCSGRCLVSQTLLDLPSGYYQIGNSVRPEHTSAMLVRILSLTVSGCSKVSQRIVSDQSSALVRRISNGPGSIGARKKMALDSLLFTKAGYIKKRIPLGSYNSDVGVVTMQTAAAAKPTTLVLASQSCTKVKVSWADNGAEETGYLVWRALGTGTLSLVHVCQANADSFIDSSVLGGQRYGYRVSAVFALQDTVTSDSGSCQLPACPPKAPYGAAIGSVTHTSLTLSWSDSTNGDHTGFIVQRRRSPDTAYAEIARTAQNVLTFGDTGLLPAEQYTYRIFSYNGVGQSALSATASAIATPLDAFDWRGAIVYYAIIDRFLDGNAGNNQPVAGADDAANFKGGDIAGLTQKIESGYFSTLGINVLWLSGFAANATVAETGSDTHKYAAYLGRWPVDFSAVDSRYGTSSDLTTFVRTAHDRGMRVVFDFEPNQVHVSSTVYTGHSDWFWPECVCGSSGCPWQDHPEQACWMGSYLPHLNLTNTSAASFVASAALKWASDYSLDGMVLPDVQYVDPAWIGAVKSSARVQFPNRTAPFPIFGSTITGDENTIHTLIDTAATLSGQVNYPLRAQVINSILLRTSDMTSLASYCSNHDSFYGTGSLMLNLLATVDFPRPIHMAVASPLFAAWDLGSSNAWSNQPSQPTDNNAYQKLGVAYAVLLTSPGIPALFYGEEIGAAGGGIPDNHRPIAWGGSNTSQLTLMAELSHFAILRAQNPVLYRGTRSTISSGTDTWVYSMIDGADTVYVAVNRGDSPLDATGLPAGSYQELTGGGPMTAPVSIPARGVLVLAKQ